MESQKEAVCCLIVKMMGGVEASEWYPETAAALMIEDETDQTDSTVEIHGPEGWERSYVDLRAPKRWQGWMTRHSQM